MFILKRDVGACMFLLLLFKFTFYCMIITYIAKISAISFDVELLSRDISLAPLIRNNRY